MRWSASKYVQVVAQLVQNRVKCGRVEELGGIMAVDAFFALVRVRRHVHQRHRADDRQEFENMSPRRPEAKRKR